MTKSKLLCLSILSAGLLLLGLYPVSWFGCAWAAWIPLFMLAESPGLRSRSFLLLVLLTALIYFGIGNIWLLYYQLPLFITTVIAFSFVIVLYFALYRKITRTIPSSSIKIIIAGALWLGLQSLVRLTPFTSAAFEAPFDGPLEFFQIAAITNYSALGALILSLSLALVLSFRNRSWRSGLWIVGLWICLGGLYVWGHHRLQNSTQGTHKVALVQHNIPISGIWRLDHPEEIRTRYQVLARKAAASKPDLIIFPLYDVPGDPLREPDFLGSLAKETATPILLASHIPELAGQSIFEHGFRNVAILYSSEGKILDQYQAVQKAPSFSPIKEYTAPVYKFMDSPLGKLGILLCYEDTKPQIAEKAKKQGAKFLVALSNPGFFNKTLMPYYHLLQDRLRAIETGLPLLRVSANGYTAHVDPQGRFIQKSELEKEEILIAKV